MSIAWSKVQSLPKDTHPKLREVKQSLNANLMEHIYAIAGNSNKYTLPQGSNIKLSAYWKDRWSAQNIWAEPSKIHELLVQNQSLLISMIFCKFYSKVLLDAMVLYKDILLKHVNAALYLFLKYYVKQIQPIKYFCKSLIGLCSVQ